MGNYRRLLKGIVKTKANSMRGLGLGLALALAVAGGSAWAADAAVKPTNLAPGTAKGTFSVDGKPVALKYAYAALDRNPFDESKDAIVVVLTDQPLEKIGYGGLRGAAGGSKTALTFMFREDPGSRHHVSGQWIVGLSEMKHEAVPSGNYLESPDSQAKVEAVVFTTARVESTVSKSGEAGFLASGAKNKYSYQLAFNAKVAPRPAEK